MSRDDVDPLVAQLAAWLAEVVALHRLTNHREHEPRYARGLRRSRADGN